MRRSAFYRRYMNSPAWKRRREAILKRADGKCEHCHRPASRLEVHHVHYENLGHEAQADLLAVCPCCHPKRDRERRKKVFRKAVKTYMTKRFGGLWLREFTWQKAEKLFRSWLRG